MKSKTTQRREKPTEGTAIVNRDKGLDPIPEEGEGKRTEKQLIPQLVLSDMISYYWLFSIELELPLSSGGLPFADVIPQETNN